MHDNVNNSYISVLPPVLITSVLSVTDSKTFLNSRQVCKLWRSASIDTRIPQWQIFYKNLWNQDPPSRKSSFESLKHRLKITGLDELGSELTKKKWLRPFSIALVRSGKFPIVSRNFLRYLPGAISDYRDIQKFLILWIMSLKTAREKDQNTLNEEVRQLTLDAEHYLAEVWLNEQASRNTDPEYLQKLLKLTYFLSLFLIRQNPTQYPTQYEVLITEQKKLDDFLQKNLDEETWTFLSNNLSNSPTFACFVLKNLIPTDNQQEFFLKFIFAELTKFHKLEIFIKRYLTLLHVANDFERIHAFVNFLITHHSTVKKIRVNYLFIDLTRELDIPYNLLLTIMDLAFKSRNNQFLIYCTNNPDEHPPMQWLTILSKKSYQEPADEAKMIAVAEKTIQAGCKYNVGEPTESPLYHTIVLLNPKLLQFFLQNMSAYDDVSVIVNRGLESLLNCFAPSQEEITAEADEDESIEDSDEEGWDEQSMSLCKEVVSIIFKCPYIQIEDEVFNKLEQCDWLEEIVAAKKYSLMEILSGKKISVKRKKPEEIETNETHIDKKALK